MDIGALWTPSANDEDLSTTSVHSDIDATASRRSYVSSLKKRRSIHRSSSDDLGQPTIGRRESGNLESDIGSSLEEIAERPSKMRKLVLPTDVCTYSHRCWLDPEVKKIRRIFVSNGIFFPVSSLCG